MSLNPKKRARLKRKKSIRKKVSGVEQRPRLTVFRSAKHIYVQAVDDQSGRTLASASSLEKEIASHPDLSSENKKGKITTSAIIGKLIAKRLVDKGINKVVFDRNGFLYHGRIKAISEGAREGGLVF